MALVVFLLLMQHATKEEEDKAIVIVTLPGRYSAVALVDHNKDDNDVGDSKNRFCSGWVVGA